MTEDDAQSMFTGYQPKIMHGLQYEHNNATSISFRQNKELSMAKMSTSYEHNKPELGKGAHQYEINKPKMKKHKTQREKSMEWDEIMSRIQQLKER